MNYMFFQKTGLPDIKVNDLVKVNNQYWLVNLIINPGTENCNLQCFRNSENKTFSIKEVQSVQ